MPRSFIWSGASRALRRLLVCSAGACASITLLPPAVAQGQTQHCTADEPLRLFILFDNSASINGRIVSKAVLSAWFRSLADALRPGDEFTVYSLATKPHPVIHRLGWLPITHTQDWNYRQQPERISEELRRISAAHTDLTLSVDRLRDTLAAHRRETHGCGDAVVLVSDGTLDPYTEDQPPDEIDPASIESEFINHVHAMLNGGIPVYAVGLAAESAPPIDAVYEANTRKPEYAYQLHGIRSGRDLLVTAVGASRYIPWDSASVKTLVQGDSASLFPSILGLRDATHLTQVLDQTGFGYIVFRMKSDSVDSDGSCEPATRRYATSPFDTVIATRLGAECYFHARNPSALLRRQLATAGGGLDVLRYGFSRLLNFDATPDSVYDPLQIIVTRFKEGDQARAPCTQTTLLNALSRYGWPPRDKTDRIAGRIVAGAASPDSFVRIPETNCYALQSARPESLPTDSTFAVTVEDPGRPPHSAAVLLHRAQSPVSGVLFHSVQPLLSALFRRHEYSLTGVVRLADSSFAHAMRAINVGGEQVELEPASPSDCSELPVAATSASVCLRLQRGVVVKEPPNAGYVIFNAFLLGDCSDAGARCRVVRISRTPAVLAWFWLVTAFFVGFLLQIVLDLYQSRKQRHLRITWLPLLVLGGFTGLASAWLVDEIAWKIQTEHHLSLMLVLEVLRITVELCFAVYSGELLRHVVKSGIEWGIGT